ncbi:phosphate starvation-inducible PhoH-like protein [Elusimicrobium posterum]|uniref:PhoH family protein n=1 Tax=Elusimicrobium posterum TaxID=3116653 RepID=UPI003C76CA5A
MLKKIKLKNQDEVFLVLGEQDANLKKLEKEFKVEIYVRYHAEGDGAEVSVSGAVSRVDKAVAKMKKILNDTSSGPAFAAPKPFSSTPFEDGVILHPAHHAPIKPRTENQKIYLETVFKNDLTIASGPAGTGKTFLACACALRALELGMVSRIIVSRPIVEAGEKLGFLPGDIDEKVDPYLRPVYDAFQTMLGMEKFRALKYNNVIEIVPLAYMRGRTLENAFIILDEAQNTLPEQIKMFLTRMGRNSRMVINGDPTQIDLPLKKESGLLQILKILKGIEDIAIIEFNEEDVVRHELIKKIIKAYAKWDKKQKASS